MIWGNATEYNCENQCTRDQLNALVSNLITRKVGEAWTWIIDQNFLAKFKDANFDVSH